MAEPLVTLSITLANGGADAVAELVWVAANGDEQKYGEVRERATIKQETFAGHCWLLRGARTRQVLLRIEAQAQPAVQEHRIDADELPAAGDAAADGDDATDTPDAADGADVPGCWVGSGGTCKFVRVPQRAGAARAPTWHELDADGNVVGTLSQVDVRVDTRWLWWAGALYRRLATMSNDKEVRARPHPSDCVCRGARARRVVLCRAPPRARAPPSAARPHRRVSRGVSAGRSTLRCVPCPSPAHTISTSPCRNGSPSSSSAAASGPTR